MQEDTMKKKIRGLAAATAVVSVFGAAAVLPVSPSHAAVARGLPAGTQATPLPTPAEKIGCYRLGEYGYTWYPFCVGPRWLYPHHRVCRAGHCWYQ